MQPRNAKKIKNYRLKSAPSNLVLVCARQSSGLPRAHKTARSPPRAAAQLGRREETQRGAPGLDLHRAYLALTAASAVSEAVGLHSLKTE